MDQFRDQGALYLSSVLKLEGGNMKTAFSLYMHWLQELYKKKYIGSLYSDNIQKQQKQLKLIRIRIF